MIKTEYRILPYQTFIADLYLQFKSIERKKKFGVLFHVIVFAKYLDII